MKTQLDLDTFEVVCEVDDLRTTNEWKRWVRSGRSGGYWKHLNDLVHWFVDRSYMGSSHDEALILLGKRMQYQAFDPPTNQEIRMLAGDNCEHLIDGTKRSAILTLLDCPIPAMIVISCDNRIENRQFSNEQI